MSVRFSAADEYLTRTASVLPYNAAYTLMLWAYIVDVGLGTFPAFATLTDNVGDGTGGYDYLGTVSAGDYLSLGSQAAEDNDSGGSQFAGGTWVHVCLVRPDTSSLLGYVNGALRVTASSAASGGRGAAGRLSLGKFNADYSQMHGRVAACKAWTAALSQAEIDAEQDFYDPVVTSNVWGWWPLQDHTDLTDQSGNGRDFTGVGTLSTEADPPGVDYQSGGAVAIPVLQHHRMRNF